MTNSDPLDLTTVAVRLADLRRQRGLTMSALADRTGYSVSYISQIERGESIPSLSVLAAVASALDTELTGFFEETTEPLVSVTRAGEAVRALGGGGDGKRPHVYGLLGGLGASEQFSGVLHGLPPSEVPLDFQHFGERFVLVLSGSLHVVVDDATFELEAGEYIHYAALVHHSAHNPVEGTDTEVLWLSCPALL